MPAATLHSFSAEHFDPVVERATGYRSRIILTSSLVLAAATYQTIYNTPSASRNDIRTGESLGNGVFSLGLIASQFIFDSKIHHAQSHLRGLVYNVGFIYATKAVLKGRWPGDNYQYQEFPSVFSSIAFTSATSLSYAYGWPVALIAYPTALFIAGTRRGVDGTRLSDVFVGSAIGFWMGRASFYESNLKSDYQIYPVIETGYAGFALSGSF